MPDNRRDRSSWGKWRGLTAFERRQTVAALVWLPVVVLGLRRLGFRRLRAGLVRLAPLSPRSLVPSPDAEARAAAVVRSVRRAARFGVGRGSCLAQSLAVWWLLRRCGLDAEVCIGVRRPADTFEAHAWVQYRGTVLNDTVDVRERYAAFERVEMRSTGVRHPVPGGAPGAASRVCSTGTVRRPIGTPWRP
jgi:hypothetical protein